MKKRTIIFFLFLYQSILLDAKAQFKTNPKFGIRVGTNFSRFTKTFTNNKFYLNYSIGVTFEKPFNQKFSYISEISYSKQGNIALANNPSPSYKKLLTKYDYITAPLFIRYKPPKSILFLTGGMQIAYLVNNETIFLPIKGFTNYSDPLLKRWDSGILLGTGIRLKNHFIIDLRYFNSFSTLYRPYNGLDPITGNYVSAPAIRRFNQVLSLNFTYNLFNL